MSEMLSYTAAAVHDSAMITPTMPVTWNKPTRRRHKFTKKAPFPMNFVNLSADMDR